MSKKIVMLHTLCDSEVYPEGNVTSRKKKVAKTTDISKYFCTKRNNETFVSTFIITKAIGDVPIQT
jgi:hypothetical protein